MFEVGVMRSGEGVPRTRRPAGRGSSGGYPTAAPQQDAPLAAALNLLIGLWLFISQWVLGYSDADPSWNGYVFGSAIAVLAVIRILGGEIARFASGANMAIGAWLVIAGVLLADSGAASVNYIVVGAAVFVLAAAAAFSGVHEVSDGGPNRPRV